MRALVTAVVYFGSFLAIGLIAKLMIGRWMNRRNLEGLSSLATPQLLLDAVAA